MSRTYRAVVEHLEQRELLSVANPMMVAAAVPAISPPMANVAVWDVSSRAPARMAASAGGKVASNVVYTTLGGHAQALDVYYPAGPAPAGGWPVILAIHGGGWRRFSKDQYAAKVAGSLMHAGFAVVAPNYTLSAPGSPSWPVNIEQLELAVQWVGQNASRYDFDTSQIVAMGESAGGNLAALLGVLPSTSGRYRVRAVVDFYGPADLTTLPDQSPRAYLAAKQFLGASYESAPELYEEASPALLVTSRTAPMLIFQGSADGLVPPAQSQELAAALTRAGVRNQLVMLAHVGHGFGLQVGGMDLTSTITAFLRSVFASQPGSSTPRKLVS